jgi:hypothetical protein
MTKQQFLDHVRALYIVGNLSDSDSEQREEWTRPAMAGMACCAALDKMLHKLAEEAIFTHEEIQNFYDDM